MGVVHETVEDAVGQPMCFVPALDWQPLVRGCCTVAEESGDSSITVVGRDVCLIQPLSLILNATLQHPVGQS
jgi:hypothetical protein